jgi:hypothetical protein
MLVYSKQSIILYSKEKSVTSSQPRLAPHSQSLDSCPANAPPIESLESIQSGHDDRPTDFSDFNMMVDDDFAATGGADSGMHFYISILFVAYML